jgi:hypothetical protein
MNQQQNMTINDGGEERKSLLSHSSDNVSVLSENQGVVLENPDGTYQHGKFPQTWLYFLRNSCKNC